MASVILIGFSWKNAVEDFDELRRSNNEKYDDLKLFKLDCLRSSDMSIIVLPHATWDYIDNE